MQVSSTPNINEFVPLLQQQEIIEDIRQNFDYSQGVHEVLLSGSVGSAKSLMLAHIGCTHALMYPGACVGLGRLALPQLKDTLCRKIQEHFARIPGLEVQYSKTTGDFTLPNGSTMQTVTWADGNLAKLGSSEFSMFLIEELTETDYAQPYDVILQRTNRLPHVKEPVVISATNPDSPAHWAYKKLIMSDAKKVKVYYSNTLDNPYLPPSYIETLKERMDPKMAQRMIYGKWVEVNDGSIVYYAYDHKINFRKKKYVINQNYPVVMTWDFNIGDGKPLSLVFMQYIPDTDEWHIFNECIVDGQRTLDSLDEAVGKNLIDIDVFYKIRGDCTGRNRDTRHIGSDYDIIEKFLSNYTVRTKGGNQRLRYKIEVPRTNPPVRDRHNTVNGYCKNFYNKPKLFVYEDAKIVDEGMRLTKLKPGATANEDDTDRFQHCTTAVGYAVMYEHYERDVGRGRITSRSY